ncbi:MAG: DJ-1/PfpI family protein [Hyphomonadaceae bacterium]
MPTSFTTGFVIFPMLTQLDFTGPLQVLARMPGARTEIFAKTREPVPSDCWLSLLPTKTFAEAPQLDLLCVPGGFGVDQAMEDEETVAFVANQAKNARYVTSVCTGAFILGAAGLLQGKRATTHWAYHHLLPRFGAIPVQERVVRDGNLFTGGGVTAGIDFALTILEEIAGRETAQFVQLSVEYDPKPPLDSGSPARAPSSVKTAADERYAPRLNAFTEIVDRVAPKLQATG